MKRQFLIPALTILVICSSCGSRDKGNQGDDTQLSSYIDAEPETETGPGTQHVKDAEAGGVKTTRPYLKYRNPKPLLAFDDFVITGEDEVVITEFDESTWQEILNNNYVEESRFGNLPLNLAAGTWHQFATGELVYDSVYYYALGMLYRSSHLHKVNKFTGEETIIHLPVEGPLSFLNLWENTLYFENHGKILSYDLQAEMLTEIPAQAHRPYKITIVDNRLFYSCQREGIMIFDLQTKHTSHFIQQPVKWFWVSEDLLFYTDHQDLGFVVDLAEKTRYSTGITFLRGTYHQDRLLFSPLPYIWSDYDEYEQGAAGADEEQPDDTSLRAFTMYFGQDSLVVLPHREIFMGLLKGQFVGLPESEQMDYKRLISRFDPPFGDNTAGFSYYPAERISAGQSIDYCANMFFSGNSLVSYESFSFFPLMYFDAINGTQEKITDKDHFLQNDPRAIPPDFELFGDSLIIAQTEQGNLTIKLEKKSGFDMHLRVTGAGYDEKITHWQIPFWLTGFYNNQVMLRALGNEGFQSTYSICQFYNIDGSGEHHFRMADNNIYTFRDGILYTAYISDHRIASFQIPWQINPLNTSF